MMMKGLVFILGYDGATWTPAEFRPLILRAIFCVEAQ